MPFSRSQRLDRRKRVILDSIAADPDFAAESAKAVKKNKKQLRSSPNSLLDGFDSATYSPSVRKTCQARFIQAIPLRTQSITLVIGTLWAVWLVLVLSHYLLHSSANSLGRSPLPILQLLDLRSPHSIANWISCQLWMLTALAAWMLYSIRKHRLDDFTATYRVWLIMVAVSIFSSFDASTSALYLLGQSIDPWTRKEIGYGGWPLVLAAYASIVAMVGLRLSSELRSVSGALALWFGGLIAWGCAALLGTGLLKLQWAPGTIDLIVGACWIGGVVAVFQAVGLTLRHCFIQAQYRFVERIAFTNTKRNAWSELNGDEEIENPESSDDILDEIPKKSWLPWRRSATDLGEEKDTDSDSNQSSADKKSIDPDTPPKRPMRLFGLIPHRAERNEQPIDEPLRIDDGGVVDQGLTKKPGWFSRKARNIQSTVEATPDASPIAPKSAKSNPVVSTASPSSSAASTSTPIQKPIAPLSAQSFRSSTNTAQPSPVGKAPIDKNASETLAAQDATEAIQKKKSWLPFLKKKSQPLTDETEQPATVSSKKEASPAPKESSLKDSDTTETLATKKSWNPFRRSTSNQATSDDTDANTKNAKNAPALARSNPTPGTNIPTAGKSPERVEAFEILDEEPPKTKKLAGKILGWFDGLKLKPPKDPADVKGEKDSKSGNLTSSTQSNKSTIGSSTSNPPFPSTGPSPVSKAPAATSSPSSQPNNSGSSASSDDSDDEDDDDFGNQRPLSKAERKRLRRQGRDAA